MKPQAHLKSVESPAMVLISCEECQGSVSSRANACPHCGCPVEFLELAAPETQELPPESGSERRIIHDPEDEYVQDYGESASFNFSGKVAVAIAIVVTLGVATYGLIHSSPPFNPDGFALGSESVQKSPNASLVPPNVEPLSLSSSTVEAPLLWYQGGTLHNASLAEWASATYQNRLATAADIVSSARESNGRSPFSLRETKRRAEEIERRITAGSRDSSLGHVSVKEAGATAYVALGWWE